MADIIMPILYEANEIRFVTDGIGTLRDAVSCSVTEERNGIFELSMEYPVNGLHYAELRPDRIIKAQPNEMDNPQPFRIYRISRPMNGIVTVDAEHISYKLNAIPVAGFRASGNAASALGALMRAAVTPTGFTTASDITTAAATEITEPCSVRACLGGREGSLLDRWGGEYKFDGFLVELRAHRGRDTGVVIEYGKNLTDLTQEERIDNAYTAVMPYARKTVEDAEQFYYIPERFLCAESAGAFAFPRIQPVDFSNQFNEGEIPSEEKLRELARAYMKNNAVGVPKVSINVAFAPLWQTEEYKNIAPLERVNLCDTVTVRFPRLGVDATAKVIKTVYDVLKGRYSSIELGDAHSKFTDTVKSLEQDITAIDKKFENVPSMVTGVIEQATNLITGAKGGHVVIRCDENKKPQEILIMDETSIEAAKKVWRWNINGLGYSSKGINGPYETAITMDGNIVGKFISALTIVGNQITAGRIKSVNGNVYFDLDANGGQGEIAASSLVAPSNTNNTKAYIGTITDTYGKISEAFTFSTESSRKGKVVISVDREGRTSDKVYPYANTTRIDSDGNLEFRSNAKNKDNSWGAIMEMRQNSDGRVVVGIEASKQNSGYGEMVLDSDGTAELVGTGYTYIQGDVCADISGGGYSITVDSDGVSVTGDLHAADIYSYGSLVRSDRHKKRDIQLFKSSALKQIAKASTYQYRMDPAIDQTKEREQKGLKIKTPRRRDGSEDTLRMGLMFDEVPEEIRRELPGGQKCVDLYGMCSMLWKAVQELNEQVEKLRNGAKK